MFLGQENVGKIIAKLIIDSSEKPIPQKDMPALFKKCQKEVDDSLKKQEKGRTKDQVKADKEDQNEKNYS